MLLAGTNGRNPTSSFAVDIDTHVYLFCNPQAVRGQLGQMQRGSGKAVLEKPGKSDSKGVALLHNEDSYRRYIPCHIVIIIENNIIVFNLEQVFGEYKIMSLKSYQSDSISMLNLMLWL